MFIGILIGAVLGIGTLRFARRYRGGWRHGGDCHGRHGRGGWGGGFGGRGGFGPRRLWHLVRHLDLSPSQRSAVEELFYELRDTMRDVRHGVRSEVEPLIEALGAESFDRSRVEEAAGRQTASFERAKKQLVDAIERLHAILIPEQREQLREFLRHFQGQWSGAETI